MGRPWSRSRVGLAAIFAGAFWTAASHAGPARYDAAQRGMRFTYTYAALTEGAFGDQAIGAPQTPSKEDDALVRAAVLKVSDALSKATGGRLKILSLDVVAEAKKADLVISLTGKPPRGGWAMAGAIEGRPGQIGLYFQTLKAEWEQDVVLTAAHEICHYVFGLTDEYNFPHGCPEVNQGGPGCLMDNYLSNGSRHGWYGRFCEKDHFQGQNLQKMSCQDIVDKFFEDRGVTDVPKPATRMGALDQITKATIGRVKDEAEAQNRANGRGKAITAVSSLGSVARKFLESQVKTNDIPVDSSTMSKIIGTVLQEAAAVVRLDPPARFTSDLLMDLILRTAKERADELRTQNPKESASARKGKILSDLKKLVADPAKAPLVTGSLKIEETSFLEQVAMRAAAVADEPDILKKLYRATLLNIELSQNIARNGIDTGAEVGTPGTQTRNAALAEINDALREFLPGRTASTGFGMRRTIIIDPDPLNPRFDFVVTQAGVFPYRELRANYVGIFRKLVDRAKIELITTERQRRNESKSNSEAGAGLDPKARIDEFHQRTLLLLNPESVRIARETELREMFEEVRQGIGANKFENVIVVIPPGGLPDSLTTMFETFRRELMAAGDVRLDLVLVGSPTFPHELRDASLGTGGSITTITDADEIGALSQRLKNEQSNGAWVVLPQQDSIHGTRYDDRAAGQAEPKRTSLLYTSPQVEQPKESAVEAAFKDVADELNLITAYLHGDLGKQDVVGDDEVWRELGQMLRDTLWTNFPEKPADNRRELELIHQLSLLTNGVKQHNAMLSKGGEDTAGLFERLIRARTVLNDALATIDTVMLRYQPQISSEFDEDALFKKVYLDTKDTAKLPGGERKRLDAAAQMLLDEASNAKYETSPSTRAYLRLKAAEVRLRLARSFVGRVEGELATLMGSPAFQRIDRALQVKAEQNARDNAAQFVRKVPGFLERAPLPPAGLDKPGMVRLQRFYAENVKYDPKKPPGEFELILGLSRPLPGLTAESIRSNDKRVIPTLLLFNDNGMPVETAALELDQGVSTPNCLVWRFRPEFGIGWYTAAIKVDDAILRRLSDQKINYTFSIGSNRPNIRLTPAILQPPNDPDLVPPPPNRGLVRTGDRRIRIEVQVYGGTSVLGAKVLGVVHKLDDGSAPILPLTQEFYDDGATHGDRIKDDGIYTTIIPLDQIDTNKEYRVLIQAESNAESRNIPPEDPGVKDDERRALVIATTDPKAPAKTGRPVEPIKPEVALKFQRATSLHIRVER